eukprot:1196116-Prorocentrum_minimum.AAC.2
MPDSGTCEAKKRGWTLRDALDAWTLALDVINSLGLPHFLIKPFNIPTHAVRETTTCITFALSQDGVVEQGTLSTLALAVPATIYDGRKPQRKG